MTSIMEMPELVMEKIVGFSDFKAVLTLRQVCRDFQNFIDDLKDSKLPDSEISEIEIISKKDENKIILRFMHSPGDYHRVEYSEMENSRSFESEEEEEENPRRKTITDLGGSNVVDVAIRDLELVLRFQKSKLFTSYFQFDDFRLLNDSTIHTLPTRLSNMFNVSCPRIKTREIRMKVYDSSQILPILQFADPTNLSLLEICSMDNNMEVDSKEIVETDYWKKANEVHCDFHMSNLKVEDVCHFYNITLKTNSFNAKDMDTLKKAFLSLPEHSIYDSWTIRLKDFNESDELSNLWGPPFDFGFATAWHFRLKDLKKNVLQIYSEMDDSQEYNIFDFTIMGLKHVPNGAVVHY
ncbi:hypothetical protein B9Z55_021240 [Caenorhabditis nigoni]|uniref:F-box domain-containing protein n=1 Tax=Caenorhabditis nigoni TaxID=1611254 RepID=A0A2G5TR89_9PELO|nr:hypothetical protein B9Z55_021240 [Caenorhabditis nigoni]